MANKHMNINIINISEMAIKVTMRCCFILIKMTNWGVGEIPSS